jgi:hypothetical protein
MASWCQEWHTFPVLNFDHWKDMTRRQAGMLLAVVQIRELVASDFLLTGRVHQYSWYGWGFLKSRPTINHQVQVINLRHWQASITEYRDSHFPESSIFGYFNPGNIIPESLVQVEIQTSPTRKGPA